VQCLQEKPERQPDLFVSIEDALFCCVVWVWQQQQQVGSDDAEGRCMHSTQGPEPTQCPFHTWLLLIAQPQLETRRWVLPSDHFLCRE
jgi:hypothetical protein